MKNYKTLKKILLYVLMIGIAIIMILPFYWQILVSLSENKEIYRQPMRWYFTKITFEHYNKVFNEVEILKYLWNTILLTIINIATNLFFGSLAAYAFAKLKFKYRNLIFRIMMLSLMIPSVVTMLPTFLVILRFPLAGGNNILGLNGSGFLNTYMGILLPGTVTVFTVFFLRQFFVTLPDELGEAARIDGAGEFTVFFRVYLPLVKPGLITLLILCFQGSWNSFMWPNIILTPGNEKMPISVALQYFVSENNLDYGPMMAISLIMSFIPLLLFVVAQKYFMKGVTTTMK